MLIDCTRVGIILGKVVGLSFGAIDGLFVGGFVIDNDDDGIFVLLVGDNVDNVGVVVGCLVGDNEIFVGEIVAVCGLLVLFVGDEVVNVGNELGLRVGNIDGANDVGIEVGLSVG